MRVRKLEEVLEECLSAYLDQGRPVEESLRRYPEFRAELEPLLHTAIQVSDSFQSYDPPLAVQQRGLARFLSDARGRARLNALRKESHRGWLMELFGSQQRLGMALGGVTAALVLVSVSAAVLTSGGDDGREPTARDFPGQQDDDEPGDSVVNETPAAVRDLRREIEVLRERSRSGEISQSEVDELTESLRQLRSQLDDDDTGIRPEVEQALIEANQLAQEIADARPDLQPAVIAVQDATENLANDMGVILPVPVPVGIDVRTPAPSPGPSVAPPTTAPTAPPTAQPTPVPTAEPTPVPTPDPTPTEEAREPQIIPIQ